MDPRFESLTIFDFQKQFPDDESCLIYLSDLKWAQGFICPKCSNTKYCNGHKPHIRQCTKCNYLASPTSGTLFHQLKFSLLKAFYIIYYVSTNKKGISSTELSRKLGLRQKTAWKFKRKVMQGMTSSGTNKIMSIAEVDETLVGGQEAGVIGRKKGKKKLVVFAIEKKGRGVCRLYGKVIEHSSAVELGEFMRANIDAGASVTTDEWTGYIPLKKDFAKLRQKKSGKKGENFPELHRVIMGFKGWLRGMHHHANHLQAYINEYTYRFNRNFMKADIFENLLKRMVKAEPYPYKMFIA